MGLASRAGQLFYFRTYHSRVFVRVLIPNQLEIELWDWQECRVNYIPSLHWFHLPALCNLGAVGEVKQWELRNDLI
jgi:hypothetical protein